MKILERLRLGGGTPSPLSAPNLKLQKELKETKEQLNSILTEWKWGDQPIKSSEDFLSKMKPWIKTRNEEMEELKQFCKKHKIKSLGDIKEVKVKGG